MRTRKSAEMPPIVTVFLIDLFTVFGVEVEGRLSDFRFECCNGWVFEVGRG